MSSESEDDARPACKYGEKCYRKNPNHLKEYKHPVIKKEIKGGKRVREEDESPDIASKKRSATLCQEEENNSDDEDNENFSSTPDDDHEFIKQRFLVHMPDDFFSFWKFCQSLNPTCPQDALVESLGLRLVGPFDVLSGQLRNCKTRTPSQYLRHWRFYYDPPEFQTVLTLCKEGDQSQYHIGYFRDGPNEPPDFVASNAASNGCEISPMGPNIFAAINTFIATRAEKEEKVDEKLKSSLKSWATKNKFSLEKESQKMKSRTKKLVTKSFHKAGIVVPVDKKTDVGYRPLAITDANLKKALTRIENTEDVQLKEKLYADIEHMITCVQFANDECDYGMGLELGIDLFCFGDEYLSSAILQLLPMSYQLLKRPQFATIIKAHMADRQRKPYSLLQS